MDFSFEVSNDIYPKQIILDAKSVFSQYAEFQVTPTKVGTVSLAIKPLDKYSNSSKEIVLSFLNYILDLAANHHLERKE